jgi:ABC-type molybdate transport system substrate-binding protein
MTPIRTLAASAVAVLFAGAAQAQAPSATPPLVVYSAGSMVGALGAMLDRYTAETGRKTELHTGPAGLMLGRIEAGDKVDVFVSANMEHPQTLTAEHKSTATIVFARNRICVSARPEVGLTSANLLDKMLDPKVRIGTSTPKADPGGDYAWALFDKAGTVRPGAAETLKAKARQVAGGSIEPPAPKSAAPKAPSTALDSLVKEGIDVTIGYCSGHTTQQDTSVTRVQLPPNLAFPVNYGLTVLTTSGDAARQEAADRLGFYLMSPQAQAMMIPYGFIPVANVTAPPAKN